MSRRVPPAGQEALELALPTELPVEPGWDRSKFLVFDALNQGPYMADVVARFFSGDEEMTVRMGLFPGLLTRVVLPLALLDGQTVIPGRTPHRFKCVCSGTPLDPAKVEKASLSAATPGGKAHVVISRPVLTDRMPTEWPRAPQPIADELHQWNRREWPGKTRSLEEIRTMVTEELLASEPAQGPERSRWGGWTGLRFEPAPFFRVEFDGSRWWLVDPDGCAFFSLGVDCIRPNVYAETEGNEDLFTDLPDREGPLAHLWEEGRHGRFTLFDGLRHNLMRALGDNWFDEWMAVCRRRLVQWGFNTVGNWSHPDFCRLSGLPFVMQLANFPDTEVHLFRDFPDVFSDSYTQACKRFAIQLEQFVESQALLGYFLRNEPKWAFGKHCLTEHMLRGGIECASRRAFVEWLTQKWGSVEALNRAWGTGFPDFAALLYGSLNGPLLNRKAVKADLEAFDRVLIERYVRLPSEECKKVDPHHLNLGVRYAWLAHQGLLAGGDAFDVFSINCYADRPDPDTVRRITEATGRPVIIGEFHTGALDAGLPAGGLRMVVSQQDRADSYRYYVEQGAAIAELVGAHYFQWNDQHVVGRFDGENWQIGLVDICFRPYREFVAGARRANQRIYIVAAGRAKPFGRLPRAVPVE